MAQVNFNYRVDMSAIATPSDPAGYIIAYDLDGVLKQKDYNGNVTLVGVIASQSIPNLFYNIGGSASAINPTASIYRTGSINIGTGTATDGRFVVSSSGGTVRPVTTLPIRILLEPVVRPSKKLFGSEPITTLLDPVVIADPPKNPIPIFLLPVVLYNE